MKQKTKKEGYGRKLKNITINQGGGRYRTFYNFNNYNKFRLCFRM